MPAKILLDHTQTKTGRMLVMTEDSLKVLSECCADEIERNTECTKCEKTVVEEAGFASVVSFDQVIKYDWTTGWKNWLNHWFAIEDGEMSFEWES